MDNEKQFQELTELSKPLYEWLQKNFHLHATIVIDSNGAKVVEDLMFQPLLEK